MIPVANVRDFDAILYDFVYVGYETRVLFVSAVCITTYFVKYICRRLCRVTFMCKRAFLSMQG